jgi:hypothetical protein
MPGFGGKGFDFRDRGKCKVCEVEIPKNRFYCDDHKPVKAEPKVKEPKSRPATAVSAATAIVREGTPTTEAARKRPPTAKEWQDKMGLALALLTTWMVLRIISRSDLAQAPDEVQDEVADRLEMGEDEVDAIVDPFVALITGPLGGVNKKYGRQSLEILGVLPAALAMVTWRGRVRDFERQHCPPRQRQRRGVPSAPVPQRQDGEERPPPVWNGSTVFETNGSGLVAPQPS